MSRVRMENISKLQVSKFLKNNLKLPTINGADTAMRVESYLEHEFIHLNMDQQKFLAIRKLVYRTYGLEEHLRSPDSFASINIEAITVIEVLLVIIYNVLKRGWADFAIFTSLLLLGKVRARNYIDHSIYMLLYVFEKDELNMELTPDWMNELEEEYHSQFQTQFICLRADFEKWPGSHEGDNIQMFVATDANNMIRWPELFFYDALSGEEEFSDEKMLKHTSLYKKMEATEHRFTCRGGWCAHEEDHPTSHPKLLVDGRMNLKGTYDNSATALCPFKFHRSDNGDLTRPKQETETNAKWKLVRCPIEIHCVWVINRAYPIVRVNIRTEFSKVQIRALFALICKDLNYNRVMGFDMCNVEKSALARERHLNLLAKRNPIKATKRRKVADDRVQTNNQWYRCIVETKNLAGVDYIHEQGTID